MVTRLLVISEAAAHGRSAVRGQSADDPVVFRTPGRDVPVHTCGGCDAPLIVGAGLLTVQNVVMQCARCDAYNEPIAGPGPRDEN